MPAAIMNIMVSNYKKIFIVSCSLIGLCLLFSFPENACSQNNSTDPHKLSVGTLVLPPLYMKTESQWKGLGIDIWQAVAQKMGVFFEFREYNSMGSLLAAIENGEIDVIPALPAELRYESAMELSQSYYKSGLAIAVSAEGSDSKWLNELVLKYLARNEFPGRVQVLPGIFDEYFVVIALKEKSSLRKPINKALLKLMKTEKWTELLNRYTQ